MPSIKKKGGAADKNSSKDKKKDEGLKRKETGKPKVPPREEEEEEEFEGGRRGGPAIQQPEESSPEKSAPESSPEKAGKQGAASKLKDRIKANPKMRDMSQEEVDAYVEWEANRLMSISNQIVEYFPTVMFWHTMIVSIVAVRAPTDFALSCVLFAMMLRIIMVFGYYCNKKLVYLGAGGLEMFINFVLLFKAMGYSQADF